MRKNRDHAARVAAQRWAIAWPTALRVLFGSAEYHPGQPDMPVPSVCPGFVLRFEPLLRKPANDNDDHESYGTFPGGLVGFAVRIYVQEGYL